MPAETVHLLKAEGLTKSFGVVNALCDVDLVVELGSVHAVVGHNGAGKSTLMNLLSGVHAPDSGRILLEGKPMRFASPRDALERGVSMVHQELSIIPDLDVGENIFLGREPVGRFQLMRRRELYNDAQRVLAELNLDVSVYARCSTLSIGARQMIEIAQAVSRRAKILVLDEPTSALSENEQERLFEFIKKLQQRGLGIVYVSHKLDEVQNLSDSVTVLRDGKRIATLPTKELGHGEMVELMLGQIASRAPVAVPPQAAIGLAVTGLCAEKARLRNITFSARRGEIVGLAGMLGSGRTELLETLFGIRRFEGGSIAVGGKPLNVRSAFGAMRAKIALVPEDRRNQGIFAGLPVWKNMVMAAFADAFKASLGRVREQQARRTAREQVERFKIATSSINQEIQFLSGGNQQKVIIARWLLRAPDVLLMDDPTAGIDVGAKGEIHTIIRNLAAQGLTIILSSSEFSELLDVCHRILVIRGGRIVDEMDAAGTSEADLVRAATSGEAPVTPATSGTDTR